MLRVILCRKSSTTRRDSRRMVHWCLLMVVMVIMVVASEAVSIIRLLVGSWDHSDLTSAQKRKYRVFHQ